MWRKKRRIKQEMLKVYGGEYDWMNYRLKREDVTLHHIVKREHGGKKEWGNLALLMPTSHQYLHLIECKDEYTYEAINKVFKMINESMTSPSDGQREVIEYLLREFEREHKWDKGARGKLLIRGKYLKRW